MTSGEWGVVLSAGALIASGAGAWANIKAGLASLRAWMEARHQENVRRFEAIERKLP